jgi:hypothetical protein
MGSAAARQAPKGSCFGMPRGRGWGHPSPGPEAWMNFVVRVWTGQEIYGFLERNGGGPSRSLSALSSE